MRGTERHSLSRSTIYLAISAGTPKRSQLMMRTDLGTESKARRISHEDPCNSVLDSSASSWALMICKVGFSQLLWGLKLYWLLLRASSLSQIKLIRWTIIPISSFLGVSRRLSGRRSSRVAISGSTLDFVREDRCLRCHNVVVCSYQKRVVVHHLKCSL